MVARHTTLTFTTPRPDRRTPLASDPVAFDLANPDHYDLVISLYRGRFSGRVRAAGIEDDDGLQTVVEGLLRKSKSERSRWDPTRGSLSTWLYVAISGLVVNMADFASRRSHTAPGRARDASRWERVAPEMDDEDDDEG